MAHIGAHALGAAGYAAKAAALIATDPDAALAEEVAWQLEHLPGPAATALRSLPPLGTDRSGPLGPGLLASGLQGEAIRRLQAGLA